jgi:hypothetical protein
VDLPSGYVIMNDTLRALVNNPTSPGNLKRAEFYGRKVVLYFEYVSENTHFEYIVNAISASLYFIWKCTIVVIWRNKMLSLIFKLVFHTLKYHVSYICMHLSVHSFYGHRFQTNYCFENTFCFVLEFALCIHGATMSIYVFKFI